MILADVPVLFSDQGGRKPPPTIGTVYVEGVVQLDADTHPLLVNGNASIRNYCVPHAKYAFLKVRDIFTLKKAQDNSSKYFQITHTAIMTVGDYFKGPDEEFRKDQLERQFGQELTDASVIHVFEFKRPTIGKLSG